VKSFGKSRTTVSLTHHLPKRLRIFLVRLSMANLAV
jgi:hypothetical protein